MDEVDILLLVEELVEEVDILLLVDELVLEVDMLELVDMLLLVELVDILDEVVYFMGG